MISHWAGQTYLRRGDEEHRSAQFWQRRVLGTSRSGGKGHMEDNISESEMGWNGSGLFPTVGRNITNTETLRFNYWKQNIRAMLSS
jgi:hypothetical protein